MSTQEIEDAAKQLAQRFGYHFGTLTDGTIYLEPSEQLGTCPMCSEEEKQ